MKTEKCRSKARVKAGWDHPRGSAEPRRDVVAHRAYQIWQDRGCPEGTADDDWLQAEAEMRYAASFRFGLPDGLRQTKQASCDEAIDEASEESFPASDPPCWTHCTCT